MNTFLLNNPASKKEEKRKQIEKIKEKNLKLYQAMMEDIENGIF